jgi:hypothetical protein
MAINTNTTKKFGHASQTCTVIDLVNHSGTPKLWAMAHENGPKT